MIDKVRTKCETISILSKRRRYNVNRISHFPPAFFSEWNRRGETTKDHLRVKRNANALTTFQSVKSIFAETQAHVARAKQTKAKTVVHVLDLFLHAESSLLFGCTLIDSTDCISLEYSCSAHNDKYQISRPIFLAFSISGFNKPHIYFTVWYFFFFHISSNFGDAQIVLCLPYRHR